MIPIKVIKKDGTEKEFDINKIRKKINKAIKGTSLSNIEVESKLNFSAKKSWKTKEINDYIITTLAKEISIETPDYDIVVGRLDMDNLYKEVWKQIKLDVNDFEEIIHYLVRNGYYRKDIIDFLNNLSNTSKERIRKYIENENYDFEMKYSQVEILKSKYLLKNKKGIIEYPIISDLVNALIITEGDNDHIFNLFKLINQQYISLATPFKTNLRKPNGNTGSCFIGETDDSLASIAKTWSDISFISKNGGGVGWYLSKIRPSNTYSETVVKANLINKWIKIINDIIIAVNQGGTRKGAITVALDWWHYDFDQFLEIKTEEGDLRDKCFDIFPQAIVDNWFIEKVKNKETIYQFNHYQYKEITKIDITELIGDELYKALDEAMELCRKGKIDCKEIKANELWKQILWVWVKIGDLYIVNKDNLNKSNYLKEFGITKCSNLCIESFSLTKVPTEWKEEVKNEKRITTETNGFYHSCSLISINFAKDDIINKLEKVAFYATYALDKSIDQGTMPVKEAEISSKQLRNIGIGTVGIADFMAKNKKVFNKEEDLDFIEEIYEKLAYYTYKASIKLAKQYGPYPLFDKANYDKLFGYDPKELNKMSKNGFDWVELQKEIKENGIRNFLLLAIAPNSSTGILLSSSASYLPVYNKFNYQTLGELSVPILPKYIKDRYWYYKTRYQYHPKDIINYTRRVQRWIDTGISMEINIDPTFVKINEVSEAIIDGFLKGELKGVYYSLTKDKDRETTCEDCAN